MPADTSQPPNHPDSQVKKLIAESIQQARIDVWKNPVDHFLAALELAPDMENDPDEIMRILRQQRD
jgi:hypothetical protein